MLDSLTQEARNAPASGILDVMMYGKGKPVIPLWVGEGNLPTPQFIRDAAANSLANGETFYNSQGNSNIRTYIAKYASHLYGRELKEERFRVTSSGMHAIMLVFTMLAGKGDEVIVPTPAWPNAAAAVGVRGATPVMVAMPFGNNGFSFDIERISDAITPKTKAIFINSPSNPMGTVLDLNALKQILDLARKHNLWIVADEIYSRFYYKAGEFRAPSFHDIREEDDKIIFVNTFSKNWAMTGWRLGWIEMSPSLKPVIDNLVQYSSSGAPMFVERAGIAALEHGEEFIKFQIDLVTKNRAFLLKALGDTGRVRMASPDGAFYLFFTVDGVKDTKQLAYDLIDKAGVGLAPGSAFGKGGENFLRLCYLRDAPAIEKAAEALRKTIMAL